MLIPSIDLKDGQVVQLVQGRRLALASDDVFGWVERFAGFPTVQLIDLDAAMERGHNDALVRAICGRFASLACPDPAVQDSDPSSPASPAQPASRSSRPPNSASPARPALRSPGPSSQGSGPGTGLRVGGGIRTVARAEAVLAAGAAAVIVGSSFFRAGRPDVEFARALADAVGPGRVIAAVDSLGGRVVVRGWTQATPLAAADAMAVLEPYCGGFLYTHVDTEGLMGGIDLDAVRTVRAATTRALAVAGGITTTAEIDALDALGIDAVVGMAIYTGRLAITPPAEQAPE